MLSTIGIRAEDKNRWERRTPLTPDHVRELVEFHNLSVVVQPSPLRILPDRDYADAGAVIDTDLSRCQVILGVKEIPEAQLAAQRRYVYFSHTIKGQASNMPALQRLLDLGCTLIDYELVRDRKGRRLIFFGRHAGYAGMIDSLWALGQRLAWEGFRTPLAEIRLAHQYASLDEATSHIARLGERIRHVGLPTGRRPLVVAFTGSGNVSQGAQEVFDRLPTVEIDADELLHLDEDRDRSRNMIYKVVLSRDQRFERIAGGGFEADEYRSHPERYRSALAPLLPHISMLINGLYWKPGFPALVTAEQIRELWSVEEQPKLRVIGDITCDVEGSITINVRATDPGDPVYVWDPGTGEGRSGFQGRGPVVMAVDNLPCELPIESSEHFGDSLLRFIPPLARCDWRAPLDALGLPPALHGAIILHQGQLTPEFEYLKEYLAAH